MKLYRKIDDNGLFMEDILLDEIPYLYDEEGNIIYDTHYIENPIPSGMYAVSELTPRWNGEAWIEVVEKPIVEEEPTEKLLEVKNRADIDYLSIMLGVDL